MFTIYHNTRCSKSRQTLIILEQHAKELGLEVSIIEYLKTPINNNKIKRLLEQLGCSAIGMMRTNEKLFKQLNLTLASEGMLIQAMSDNPALIERPIVSDGKRAIIGRPPENVKSLFETSSQQKPN
jgi:arsenate reductase (glutaredoxin)